MLYAHHIIGFIILNTILITNCFDINVNISQLESELIDDFQHITNNIGQYDVTQYTLYFKSYHSVWNNHDEWTWNSNHDDTKSINETIACSKQNPSLCLNTQFITNEKKEFQSLKTLKLYYKDDKLQENNEIELDFWNDLDWSQVNIIHHHDPNDDKIDRRQLLRGALTSKYGMEYYDDEDYDDYNNEYYDDQDEEEEVQEKDDNLQEYGFAAHQFEEDEIADIDTKEAMDEYIFNQDDDISDIGNMDDYYKYYDKMTDEEWAIFGKIWRGIKRGARHIAGKLGIYPRPPCSSMSRCRVHLYFRNGFRSRANKKGHFCEGRWSRWRLHKYRVFRRRVSSIMVQGSPCCVAIVYNGDKMDGDQQAMFPRGRYRSMSMGLQSEMGTGNGMNGMGGGGLMGMMGGGMGMMGMHMGGFPDRRMASMRVVHDCKLRQNLMSRGMMRMGMGMGGMHGMGMMGSMAQMMQMMMMMRMMFPNHHKKSMCQYYSCIVKTQQSQLQQLMQMMMMSAMTNQAPITISDNTKPLTKRRRLMDESHVIGVKKCKMLYYTEICVTFDAVNNMITMDYTEQEKKELKDGMKSIDQATDSDGVSDIIKRIKSVVSVFGDVLNKEEEDVDGKEIVDWNDEIEEYDENNEDMIDGYYIDKYGNEYYEYGDYTEWVQNSDPFDMFIDYMGVEPEMYEFANNYYDNVVLNDDDGDLQTDNIMMTDDDINDINTEHRLRLFIGPMVHGMHKNELIFSDDFGYDPQQYSYLNYIPTDNDIIDYFDTFILDWNDDNDWKEQDTIKCNDVILSYISYSICVENNGKDSGLIYFNKTETSEDISTDFYKKTNFMIEKELDNTNLDIMNEKDWTEIYGIYENGTEKKKLCNYVSMIKLCVEGDINNDQESINLNDFIISIEYLSDEESKRVIREINAVLNNKMLWSDLLEIESTNNEQ